MIRVATTADIPAIVAMGRAFLRASSYRRFFAESPDQMTMLATLLIEGASSAVLVVEEEDRLVGMLGLMASPHFISGQITAGEVFWWVEPDARGTLGVRLLKAAERWAMNRGAVALQMIAPEPRVERLYERLGYEPVERCYLRRLNAA